VVTKDLMLAQELRPIEDRYLEMAEDKVYFAEQMLLRWQEQAGNLARLAERARYRRTPSGMLKVQTPPAPRREEAFSRAKTTRHNMDKLVEEAEAEYRDTPVVPDPRREP
jgi:hypothetical protein